SIESRPAAPTVVRVTAAQLELLRNNVSTMQADMAVLRSEIKLLEFQGNVCDKCGTALDTHDRGGKLQEKQQEMENYIVTINAIKKRLVSAEDADSQWRSYDTLGPDLSSELPGLKASLVSFREKQRCQQIKAQYERWVEYRENQKLVEKLPELKARMDLYQKKQTYRALADQRLQYEKYLS